MASKSFANYRTCTTCGAVFTTFEESEAHLKQLWATSVCPPPPRHAAPNPISFSEPSSVNSFSDDSASGPNEKEESYDDEKGVNAWPAPVAKHSTGSKMLQLVKQRYEKIAPVIDVSNDDVSAPASDDVDVSHAEKPSKRPAPKKKQANTKGSPYVCPYGCINRDGDITNYMQKRTLNAHIKTKHAQEAHAVPMVGFESVLDEEDSSSLPAPYDDVDMMAPVTHDTMLSPRKHARSNSFSQPSDINPKKPRLDEGVSIPIRALLDTASPSLLRQHLAQTMPALTFNKFLAEVVAVFKNPAANNYQPVYTNRISWIALNEMIAKLKWFMDQLLLLSTLIEATVHNAFNGDPIVVGKLHMLTAELMPIMQNFVEWRTTPALYAHDATVKMETIIGVLNAIGKTDMRLLDKSVSQFRAWQDIVVQMLDHISRLMDVFHTGGFDTRNNELVCTILARTDVKGMYETTKCARCTRSVALEYEKICVECVLNEAPDSQLSATVPPTEHDWYMRLAAGLGMPNHQK